MKRKSARLGAFVATCLGEAPEVTLTTADGDVPVQMFRKQMIRLGTFVERTGKWTLRVDRQRLKRWARGITQMVALGIDLPLNSDHKPGSEHTLGYIRGADVDGEWLYGSIEARGQSAIEMCQRVNRVSVEVVPSFVDGDGRQFGEAIVGLALTPRPVVSGQGGFVKIAASLDIETEGPELILALNGETGMNWTKIENLFGLEDGSLTDENAAVLLGEHQASAAKLHSTTIDDNAKIKASLDAARTELSDRPAAVTLDADTGDSLAEGVEAQLSTLVINCDILPAVSAKLLPLLAGTAKARPVALLSRAARGQGAEKSLAREILCALTDNCPIARGSKTGVQTLSRDGKPAVEETDEEVEKRMLSRTGPGAEYVV